MRGRGAITSLAGLGPGGLGLAALGLLLGGCTTSQALLLPGEDGHETGALAVLNEDGTEQVLDTPLRRARLGKGRASLSTASRVAPRVEKLLASLPPPSRSFRVYFYENTTKLVPSSQPTLDYIREEMKRRPGVEVQVTGHTDTVGSDEDNDRLSIARANEIMGVLIAQGFPREALTAVGRGERELAVPTADNVDNPENRRVEVIVR